MYNFTHEHVCMHIFTFCRIFFFQYPYPQCTIPSSIEVDTSRMWYRKPAWPSTVIACHNNLSSYKMLVIIYMFAYNIIPCRFQHWRRPWPRKKDVHKVTSHCYRCGKPDHNNGHKDAPKRHARGGLPLRLQLHRTSCCVESSRPVGLASCLWFVRTVLTWIWLQVTNRPSTSLMSTMARARTYRFL